MKNTKKFFIFIVTLAVILCLTPLTVKAANKENDIINNVTDNGEVAIDNVKLVGENVDCYNVEETNGTLTLSNKSGSDEQKKYAFGSGVNKSDLNEGDFVEVTFDVLELGEKTFFWFNGFTTESLGFTDDNNKSFKAFLYEIGMAGIVEGPEDSKMFNAAGQELTKAGAWVAHGLTGTYLNNHITAYGNLSMKFEFYQDGTIKIYYGFIDRDGDDVDRTVWKYSMGVTGAYSFNGTQDKYYFSFGIGNAITTEKLVVDNYNLEVVSPAQYGEEPGLTFTNPTANAAQKFAAFGAPVEKAKLSGAEFVEVTFDVLELDESTWFWLNGFTTDSFGFTDDAGTVFKTWLKANGQAGIVSGPETVAMYSAADAELAKEAAWVAHGLTTGYLNNHITAYGNMSMKFEFYLDGTIKVYFGYIDRTNGASTTWTLSMYYKNAYSFNGTSDKYYFSFGIGNAVATEKLTIDNYQTRVYKAAVLGDTKLTLTNEGAGAAQKYTSFGGKVSKAELANASYVEATFDVFELDESTWFWLNGFTTESLGFTDDSGKDFKAWLKANGQAGVAVGPDSSAMYSAADAELAKAGAWVAHGLTTGYLNNHITAYGNMSMKFEFYVDGTIRVYYGYLDRVDGTKTTWKQSMYFKNAYSFSGTKDNYYFSFGIGNGGADEKMVVDNFELKVCSMPKGYKLVNTENGAAQKYAAFGKGLTKAQLEGATMVEASFDVLELSASTWFWLNGFTTESLGFTDDSGKDFKAWLKANGQAGVAVGPDSSAMYSAADAELAKAGAWVAHGLTTGYLNNHITAYGNMSMKFEFYVDGTIRVYYGYLDRVDGTKTTWTQSMYFKNAYSYDGTKDNYYFSFGIGNGGADETIKFDNFELKVYKGETGTVVDSDLALRSAEAKNANSNNVTFTLETRNITIAEAKEGEYVDVTSQVETQNASSKLIKEETKTNITYVDFSDYSKFVDEPTNSDEIATKNYYKVTYIKATNPAQDNRIASLSKLKYDEQASVAFTLEAQMQIAELADNKKIVIAFGLESRDQELDTQSYLYFVKKADGLYFGYVKSGEAGTTETLLGDLVGKEFFDINLSCDNELKVTGTVNGVEVNAELGAVAGYMAFTQLGEGNSTYSLAQECVLKNYTYRAGTGLDIEHPFNVAYLDSDLFVIQSNQSSYIADVSESQGLDIDEGELKFIATGLHTHFATKETYADFILEFDFTSEAVSSRPELGEAGAAFGYSGLGVCFGKPEALGAWSTGKLIMIRDTYTANENFAPSYVQFYKANGAQDVETKALATRVEALEGTEGAITSSLTNYTYTVSPVEGMPKIYDATTRFRLVVINNYAVLYGANVVDGTCGEFVEVISGTVKDSYGYISLSTDTNGCFSIDNFRLYNLDEEVLSGATREEILSNYDDNKVLADVVAPTKIATPTLTLTNNTVSWDAIEGATGYVVTLNGVQLEKQTETSYTIRETTPGEYVVTVQAISDGSKTSLDSNVSKSVTYVVEDTTNPDNPDNPDNPTTSPDDNPTTSPENPTTDNTKPTETKKKGCKGSIGLSLLSIPLLIGTVLVIKKRKEE